MHKRIISAILVMAMIVSMSLTALISSVGSIAVTDFEADRAELQSLIRKLVAYGPGFNEETNTFI